MRSPAETWPAVPALAPGPPGCYLRQSPMILIGKRHEAPVERHIPRLEIRNLVRRYEGRPVVDDVSLTIMPGQVTCLLGPIGLRQVDDVADDRRGRDAGQRRDLGRRQAGLRHGVSGAARTARDRADVSGFRAVSASQRGRQRGVRAEDGHEAGKAGAGDRAVATGRSAALHRRLSAPALGRRAAAGGAGPRIGAAAADHADGRAVLGTGQPAARWHPRRDAGIC